MNLEPQNDLLNGNMLLDGTQKAGRSGFQIAHDFLTLFKKSPSQFAWETR